MYFCLVHSRGRGFLDIVQIVGLGLIATFLILVLKEQKPIFAFSVAIFVGAIIFIAMITKISGVFLALQQLAGRAKVDGIFFETIIKIVGIAYIAEFGVQVTKDAGQGAIASKIELAGKVLIMMMAVPIITTIVDIVVKLLPLQR